jgi:SAM-dependent methyltransferase
MNNNRQAYDHFGEQYHKKRRSEKDSLWNTFLDAPTLRCLLGTLSESERVLDLGCGSGIFTAGLKAAGINVSGVDYSEALISIAKKENPEIDFSVSNIKATPFENEAFTTVVSGLVLHYEKLLGPVFTEVARILKPNGVFVFTMHHPIDEVKHFNEKGQFVLGQYFHNDQYTWSMLEGMELTSYHHTFEDISESLYGNGFVIERIKESRAPEDTRLKHPKFYERTNAYPSFCGFRARKV